MDRIRVSKMVAALHQQQEESASAFVVRILDERQRQRERMRRYRARKKLGVGRKKRPITSPISDYVYGEAATYDELVRVLAIRRKELGLTQIEVDERAGLQPGYTGKLEIGAARGGRNLGAMTLPLLLGALGVKLQVVKAEEARR